MLAKRIVIGIILALVAMAAMLLPPPSGEPGREAQAFVVWSGDGRTPEFWNVDTVDGKKTLNYRLNIGDYGFIASDKADMGSAVTTWQYRTVAIGGDGNLSDLGKDTFDVRSIALHEVGHTLGLDHPNVGGTGANRRDPSDNNMDLDTDPLTPWDEMACPDFPDGLLDLSNVIASKEEAEADPTVEDNTEAVMVQGARLREKQRLLIYDDLNALRYIERGPDLSCGGTDNFEYKLVNAGEIEAQSPPGTAPPAGTQVLFSNIEGLASLRGAAVTTCWSPERPGFASCQVKLDLSTDGKVVGETDVYFDSSGNMAFADVFIDGSEPEPPAIAVGGIAVLPEVAQGPAASHSRGSAGNYAAAAGGLAAAILAMSAGAWYARRRWSR